MTRRWMWAAVPALLGCAALFGGGMVLEVGNPEANPEAKKMGAILVARATACSQPAKSTVTASLVRMHGADVEKVPLTVTRLSDAGVFAITGKIEGDRAVIELTMSNPEYGDHRPHTLVRVERGAIQWASLKRYPVSPRTEDLKELLAGSTQRL